MFTNFMLRIFLVFNADFWILIFIQFQKITHLHLNVINVYFCNFLNGYFNFLNL